MDKFKVDDLVRVKPKRNIAPGYRLTIGHIIHICYPSPRPYIVSIKGEELDFAEDELEKV